MIRPDCCLIYLQNTFALVRRKQKMKYKIWWSVISLEKYTLSPCHNYLHISISERRKEEKNGFEQYKCYLSQSKGFFHCPAQRDSLFHLKIYMKSLNSVGGRPWPKPGTIRDNYLILFPLNIIQLPDDPNSKKQNQKISYDIWARKTANLGTLDTNLAF